MELDELLKKLEGLETEMKVLKEQNETLIKEKEQVQTELANIKIANLQTKPVDTKPIEKDEIEFRYDNFNGRKEEING